MIRTYRLLDTVVGFRESLLFVPRGGATNGMTAGVSLLEIAAFRLVARTVTSRAEVPRKSSSR